MTATTTEPTSPAPQPPPDDGAGAHRRRWGRAAGTVATVGGLALALLGVAGVAAGPSTPADPAPQGRAAAAAAPAGESVGRATTDASIASLQERLRRLPQDWSAWAALGSLYLQQSRLTADPSFYSKAEGSLRRSLELRPDGNADALTGQAALAAARHDFAAALDLARRAQRLNAYSAANQGVLVDALVELGRYDEAERELQRMVDLKPGVPSFTRIGYLRELRGDVDGARLALERALAVAYSSSDAAYAAYHLGELAFNRGDLDTATQRYDEGLRRDPSSAPLLAGRAKAAAARGDTEAALRDYRDVVARLPQPSYVLEYADLLAALGRGEEAAGQYAVVDAAQRLFRAEGSNVDLELALYDADRGRPREALAAAQAEWQRRRSVHTEDAYAWALHVNGRHREALVHAKAAERLGLRSALFAYHRGLIERALGDEEAATASLRRALDINPHFSPLHAPRARQALAEMEAA